MLEPSVRHRGRRVWLEVGLAGLEASVGFFAVYGAVMLITDAWGLPVDDLEPLPVGGWVLPGVALLALVAVPMLTAAVLVCRRQSSAAFVSVVAGLLLVGWVAVQVAVIGLQMFMQPLMFGLGLVVAGLGWRWKRWGS
jgi:hypothetical protein